MSISNMLEIDMLIDFDAMVLVVTQMDHTHCGVHHKTS